MAVHIIYHNNKADMMEQIQLSTEEVKSITMIVILTGYLVVAYALEKRELRKQRKLDELTRAHRQYILNRQKKANHA